MAINFSNINSKIKLTPNYIISADNTFLVKNEKKKYLTKTANINFKNRKILKYLKKNKITLFLPIEYRKRYESLKLNSKFFISRHCPLFYKNTNPLLPLGVANMSFFNALSIGLFMGYKKIYFIGVDNTYPKDVWTDNKNKLYNIERLGKNYYLSDQTTRYKSITDMYYEISLIFYSLNLYRKYKNRIYNLDYYSLTDIFKKTNLKKIFIFNDKKNKKNKYKTI